MELATLLEKNREAILEKWFDLIIGTYPRVASELLAKQKDQFRNPLGHAITESIGPIFDQVVSAMDTDELLHALDAIVRIRSVQDFSPSEAVAFVFQLKTAIRSVMGREIEGAEKGEELADLEARIDRVVLLAFEKYTECREKLHEIRNNEIRTRTMKLLERVNGVSAIPQRQEELTDDDV